MNERTTLEKIAPTVEEAVADGLTELGLTAEAVDVEVLDGGSRGLFGVGSRQARVRLTVKTPPSGPGTGLEKPETPRGKASSRSDVVVPVPGRDVVVPVPGRDVVVPVPGRDEVASAEVSEDAFSVLDDNLLFISRQTVAELLEKMKVPAHIEVRYGEPDEEGQRPVMVDVQGDDLGVLIGRRAEILNALQYVVNLIVSKQVERWVQVTIDVQGYRARHERQLRQMAQRMADQAMKAGRRQVLEPMSASDRRIIHLALRDHPSVTTQSVGEEPTRKVTIVPKE
jgi:spoIIIJ-associated protein